MNVNNDSMEKSSIRKQDLQAADAEGKPPRQFFRASNRVFCLNGEWFFQTREIDHGPFTCRAAAEQALDRYVGDMEEFGDGTSNFPNPSYPSEESFRSAK